MLPYPKRPLTPDTSSSSSRPRSVRFKADLTEERVMTPDYHYRDPNLQYSPRQYDDVPDGQEIEEEEGEDDRDDERNDGKKKIPRVLALHAPNGANLSAAYYDVDSRKLYILEDTKDTVYWDLAMLIVEQWRPEMIILSWKAQESLLEKIDEYCTQVDIAQSELQPAKTFTHNAAVHQLSQLQLGGRETAIIISPDPDSTMSSDSDTVSSNVERFAKYREDLTEYAGMGRARLSMVKLGCWVNLDVPLAVCTAGGLLAYLSTLGSNLALGEYSPIEVDSIESMQLDQHMFINNDALTSLSIFDYERHGFIHNDKKKEALSIYTCLRTTVTPLGHKLLREWLLRPLTDLNLINARHDAVQAFSDTSNQETAEHIRKSMGRVKNIPIHLKRISRGRGGYKEWRALVDAIIAANNVREQMVTIPGSRNLEIARKVKDMLSDRTIDFQRRAIETIDFDSSRNENKVCVRPGVDQDLDDLRYEYGGLADILDAVANKIRPTMDPRWEIDLTAIFFPQIGFLVSVQVLGSGFCAPRGWSLRFHSEDAMYFKTPEMTHLDQNLGDIEGMMESREIEVVQTIVEDLKEIELEVSQAMDVIAEVDCLLALARAVNTYQLVRPVMVEEPVLEIRGGRHILQEIWVQRYISNNTVMAGGSDSDTHNMMIVTGANGSGKSAYGRQVAVMAFMAQIGSFVPAEAAKIGMVDKIYTRMQTRESASKDSSAFMIDLSQVSLALRGATSRSLIILDEFGKGTTPADGAGLLAGVIEYLLNGPCPRTIILTHFHELFTQQFVDDSLPILHCYMKTELEENTKALTYLYRLCPGKGHSSNAAECALAHGLPRKIVNRAKVVSEHIAKFEIAKLHDTQLTEQDIAELREAEDLAKRFFEWEIDEKNTDVMEIFKDIMDQVLSREEVKQEDGVLEVCQEEDE